jgi:NIMA (never in mitosis gene a)-related kinase
MDSKYVIKYYDCFLEDGKLNIVMQYAPNGTLHSRLHAQRGKALPED